MKNRTNLYIQLSEPIKKSLSLRYKNHVAQAIRRGKLHTLKESRYTTLVLSRCFYCGGLPGVTILVEDGSYRTSGIDRKDSSKGYTNDNSVPCCKRCNIAKGTLSVKDFLDLATIKAMQIHTEWEDFHWKNIVDYQIVNARINNVCIMDVCSDMTDLDYLKLHKRSKLKVQKKWAAKIRSQNKIIREKEDLKNLVAAVNSL